MIRPVAWEKSDDYKSNCLSFQPMVHVIVHALILLAKGHKDVVTIGDIFMLKLLLAHRLIILCYYVIKHMEKRAGSHYGIELPYPCEAGFTPLWPQRSSSLINKIRVKQLRIHVTLSDECKFIGKRTPQPAVDEDGDKSSDDDAIDASVDGGGAGSHVNVVAGDGNEGSGDRDASGAGDDAPV